MGKYRDLISVIDKIRSEAPAQYVRYHVNDDNLSDLENARSKAYIHMFLRVKFGLLDFEGREHYITDGPQDGGIDAYYIDTPNKVVYFIQSKFRNTENNFEGKEISYDELLTMDINRIVDGETASEDGLSYNGKIQQLLREISSVPDLARYDYKVILLANLKDKNVPKLRRLIGQYVVEIYSFERVYTELVFPIVSGTYYDPKELKITLNVNRESGGSRIQYYPDTEYGCCTVNVQFVPTMEIGRVLYQYKNSILKYNPRSYLDLKTGSINDKIASSIRDKKTNEFSLFNNGITMLSDETVYNDTVGRRNTAIMIMTNPQIINGGQTAYTLSRLYEECLAKQDFSIFGNKEVLLKVISFNDDENQNTNQADIKLSFIEKISIATNQQSPVSEADRRANDKVQIELQKLIFNEFGLYYERKRGEFSDGIKYGYIKRNQLIDREDFIRCCLASQNQPVRARQVSAKILFLKTEFDKILPDSSEYKRYVLAYKCYCCITKGLLQEYNIKEYAKYSIVCVLNKFYSEDLQTGCYDEFVLNKLTEILSKWSDFEDYVSKQEENRKYYFKEVVDADNKIFVRVEANWQGYYKGRTLLKDLKAFFNV